MLIEDAMPSRRLVMKALAVGIGSTAAHGADTSAESEPLRSGQPYISVRHFGARGDGSTDDTEAFEQAIQAATITGLKLSIPAGRYRVVRTLEINRGIRIEGDGIERTVILAGAGQSQPVFHVRAKETDSIIGFGLSGLRLICDQGAGLGDGIRLSTGGKGAAIHQATLRDLHIRNVGTGIALSGVIYRSCLDNITVTGRVIRYGLYCDADFEDVTYNSFWNLEVTGVASGAYAYWIHSNFSNFVNLTADGCGYFSSPGGAIRNIAIEGILAENPPSKTALQFNQVQIVDGINLLAIDPRKCTVGFHVIGQGAVFRGIRLVGLRPVQVLTLDASSEGVINGAHIDQEGAFLEDYIPAATLDRWVLQGADAITRRQLTYGEGEWRPALSGWAVPPEIDTATWERVGRRVFVSISARGGRIGSGTATLGLPALAKDGLGAVVDFGSSGRPLAARTTGTMSSVVIAGPLDLQLDGWELGMTFRLRR